MTQYNAASMYKDGLGITLDFSKAFYWFKNPADSSHLLIHITDWFADNMVNERWSKLNTCHCLVCYGIGK